MAKLVMRLKRHRISIIIKFSLFVAAVLAGVTFSFQVQAQCPSPPSGAPGPTTTTGSGTLSGPLTYVFGGSAYSVYLGESADSTFTPGGFHVAIGSCGSVPYHYTGTLSVGSGGVSWTKVTVAGYGASADVGPAGTVSNPKNNGPANPTCSACTLVGDPINAATGNLYEVETDFVGAPSTHLELKRYYNSQTVLATPFGQGWRSTYDRTVTSYGASPTYAQVTAANGRMDSFSLVSGVWVSDADVTSTLTAVMSGGVQIGWQVFMKDDETENYNMAGQLTSIVTRAGLTTTLTYTGNQLTAVTGPFGHTLTYTYNANGNVATITLPDSGILTYGYSSHNNLASVIYPDTTSRLYSYMNASYVNALTGITDELSHSYASFTYGASPYVPSTFGLATSAQHAGGADATSVSYSYFNATVTDPNSNSYSYNFTNQFGVVKPMSTYGVKVPFIGGNAFSYDSNGFISSKTDYNGNITHYAHDARGNETSRTEAYGTALARTITTTWHSTFHLPLVITEPSRTTTFTYDTNGNTLTKTISDGTHNREWQYTYNTSGQVLTAEDPDTNVTTYTYNADGTLATMTDAATYLTQFTSYDADGRLLSKTDPNGLVTALTYDARGRLTSKTVGTEVTGYTYDFAGNLTKITFPDSSYYSFIYDNAHRLNKITDALGNYISYTLDPASNITARKVYNPTPTLMQTRTFTYDSVERLATDPAPLKWSDLKYNFWKEDYDGKKTIQTGRDCQQAAASGRADVAGTEQSGCGASDRCDRGDVLSVAPGIWWTEAGASETA